MVLGKTTKMVVGVLLCAVCAIPVAYAVDAVTPNPQANAMSLQQMQVPLAPATIQVGDSRLPYVDAFEASTAPQTGAGLWMGSDSTTDGSWGYFIGHNPGPFHEVMGLEEGDTVIVCDRHGHQRAYCVASAFQVTDDTCWEDIASQVTNCGESVVLQTCCGDNAHYRIVVCASSFPDE